MDILLNVSLEGSGTDADPYRVNLPTSRMVTVDYDAKVAIVAVPLDTLGLSETDLVIEQAHPTTEGNLYTQLHSGNLVKVQRHFYKTYPGTEYALELVSG